MAGLRVACIGEAMLELQAYSIPGPARIGVAGDVLNTAIYLRRALPASFQVSFVSRLGQDRLSDDMVAFIDSHGIDTSLIGRSATRLPGTYAITTDSAGERSFHYWRKDAAARELFQQDTPPTLDNLAEFDVVYLSGITLAILPPDIRRRLLAWIDGFRAQGGRFVFDSNYRPVLWETPSTARDTIAAAWQRCDIALPSVDDEMALFGECSTDEVLSRFQTYSHATGALKRAARGPVSINSDATSGEFAAAETVVDTTAAGDGFNGGYLAARLAGQSQSEALTQGHALACRIIGHAGAILPVA